MSKGFKFFLAALGCVMLVFIAFRVSEAQKDKKIRRAGERMMTTQIEWVKELLKLEVMAPKIFEGCGYVKFGSDPSAKLPPLMKRNDPFAIVYEFESIPESCLKDASKMDRLAEVARMLQADGLVELTFLDTRSKQPIIKYSAKSGWTNYTKIPMEFPKSTP